MIRRPALLVALLAALAACTENPTKVPDGGTAILVEGPEGLEDGHERDAAGRVQRPGRRENSDKDDGDAPEAADEQRPQQRTHNDGLLPIPRGVTV